MLDTLKTTLKLGKPSLLREQAYINGAWVGAVDGGTFPVTNPADGSLVASVPQLGVAETRAAIEVASLALEDCQGAGSYPASLVRPRGRQQG